MSSPADSAGHLSRQDIERFVRAREAGEVLDEALITHLAGCARCVGVMLDEVEPSLLRAPAAVRGAHTHPFDLAYSLGARRGAALAASLSIACFLAMGLASYELAGRAGTQGAFIATATNARAAEVSRVHNPLTRIEPEAEPARLQRLCAARGGPNGPPLPILFLAAP